MKDITKALLGRLKRLARSKERYRFNWDMLALDYQGPYSPELAEWIADLPDPTIDVIEERISAVSQSDGQRGTPRMPCGLKELPTSPEPNERE